MTSYLGPLAIEFGAQLYAVNAGTTYRVLPSADPQEPQGEGTPGTKRRKLVLVLVAVGVAAAAGILA